MTAVVNEPVVAPVEPLELDVIEVAPGKIDPSLKQVFVTALRSGKYQQGKGYFRQGDRYCALGVLLDTQGFDMPLGSDPMDYPDTYSARPGWERARELIGADAVEHIWMTNDWSATKSSFPEIADWVEENL